MQKYCQSYPILFLCSEVLENGEKDLDERTWIRILHPTMTPTPEQSPRHYRISYQGPFAPEALDKMHQVRSGLETNAALCVLLLNPDALEVGKHSALTQIDVQTDSGVTIEQLRRAIGKTVLPLVVEERENKQ